MNQPMTLQELQAQIDTPPYHQFLRPVAVSIDPKAGEVVLRLPFRPEFQRSPDRPELHGGITSALIDLAGDYALAARLGYGVPTINLRVDYLSMAVDTAQAISETRSPPSASSTAFTSGISIS